MNANTTVSINYKIVNDVKSIIIGTGYNLKSWFEEAALEKLKIQSNGTEHKQTHPQRDAVN